jgi:hypothetical protein
MNAKRYRLARTVAPRHDDVQPLPRQPGARRCGRNLALARMLHDDERLVLRLVGPYERSGGEHDNDRQGDRYRHDSVVPVGAQATEEVERLV